MITQAQLKSLFHYDPMTGLFMRTDRVANCVHLGDFAGATDTYGYRQIKIKGRSYLAHRLAWLYMTGEMPSDEIDHINADRRDNRWSNLRQADRSMNNQNRNYGRALPCGVYQNRGGRFISRLTKDRQRVHLGMFDTPEEAHAAYEMAVKRYEFPVSGPLAKAT